MSQWRRKLHDVIFEAETPAGRMFDIVLFWAIVLSVLAVVLESVPTFNAMFGYELNVFEWLITVAFTIELFLRLICIQKPRAYLRSFYGIVDIVSITPSYFSLVFDGGQSLMVIRALRMMRVFRVFKLARYMRATRTLLSALRGAWPKIAVFLGFITTVILIVGTVMYMIEGGTDGFYSIPDGIYWSIVTMTTVGYGDIVPNTVLGRILASILMLTGYGVIAVPTGIMSAEIAQQVANPPATSTKCCASCSAEDHVKVAKYCYSCGEKFR